jgi:hypothetical protein
MRFLRHENENLKKNVLSKVESQCHVDYQNIFYSKIVRVLSSETLFKLDAALAILKSAPCVDALLADDAAVAAVGAGADAPNIAGAEPDGELALEAIGGAHDAPAAPPTAATGAAVPADAQAAPAPPPREQAAQGDGAAPPQQHQPPTLPPQTDEPYAISENARQAMDQRRAGQVEKLRARLGDRVLAYDQRF